MDDIRKKPLIQQVILGLIYAVVLEVVIGLTPLMVGKAYVDHVQTHEVSQ